MDPTKSTSRISAYFSFGVQWGTPTAQAQAAQTQAAQATDANANATQRTGTGRVIDVQAQAVNPDPSRRKNPTQPLSRQSSNIFLSQAPATTYAPPQSTGQAVRLLTTGQTLGQKLDTWG